MYKQCVEVILKETYKGGLWTLSIGVKYKRYFTVLTTLKFEIGTIYSRPDFCEIGNRLGIVLSRNSRY